DREGQRRPEPHAFERGPCSLHPPATEPPEQHLGAVSEEEAAGDKPDQEHTNVRSVHSILRGRVSGALYVLTAHLSAFVPELHTVLPIQTRTPTGAPCRGTRYRREEP